jgi:hypothetical protein
LGKDVITQAIIDKRKEITNDLLMVIDRHRSDVEALDIFMRGWFLSFRNQSFQQGGTGVADYFTHPDFAKCERNALAFAYNLPEEDITDEIIMPEESLELVI